MRYVRRAFWIALFVGAVYVCVRFPAHNDAAVAIHYLVDETPEIPLWLALVASFLAGAVCASVVSWVKLARLRLQARRYRKEVIGLESEVHQLRNLPLAPAGPDAAATEPTAAVAASGRALERGA